MKYYFVRGFFDWAYQIIDRIGVDTFIMLSICLWGLFIWNLIRKGTRF